MQVSDYYRQVFVPANAAITAMQIAGIPVSKERAAAQVEAWTKELKTLEKYVEEEAAQRGIALRYSPAHSLKEEPLHDFLFASPRGLCLEVGKQTASGKRAAMDDEAMLPYAAIGPLHREDDHPIVYALLKIRSISKAMGTHLGGLVKYCRADGAAHPHYKWILQNTTRLSAEDPPVHQLPERADPDVAKLVKACIVPRVEPWLGDPDDWDPREHGFVFRADVAGAEAIIRAGCIAKCRVSVPYLQSGGDIHSRTASILYLVPEGTYKKGTNERDTVGKGCYFLFIFGGSKAALRRNMWKNARVKLSDEESGVYHQRFFAGYADLATRYNVDTMLMFENGYVEDLYGRRWVLPPPPGVSPYWKDGELKFNLPEGSPQKRNAVWRTLENRRHIYANRPTQASQATTTLWCIALCHHGEYVELQSPECLGGVPIFPEASGWALNGGSGPGGKPMLAWTSNTVHDSLWGDGAPGYIEPTVKLITRRFTGVPADFLIETNMPWRVGIDVGPDMGHLRPYNDVAKQFGLEPLPKR
jgi:hypothetical protein